MSLTYEQMLDRLYVLIPKKSLEKERFEFPKVESFMQGPKTYVKNFPQLLKMMRREAPRDLLKFLTKESASPVKEEGDRLAMSGKFSEKQINDWITRFLVLLLSLAIFAIAFKAYRKTGSERLKYVLIAFALFAVKWAIKVVDVFVSPGRFFNDASENVFELLILGALFMALFRKE